MKDKIKVYIEKDAFEKFILHDGAYENLFTIFTEHSVFYMNMTDADIKNEWQLSSLNGQRGGSKLQKFFTGHNLKRPESAIDYFNALLCDNKKILEHSRSIFFLNITPEEAEKMRDKYGVMVLSKDNFSDDIFQFHIKDSIKKGEIKNGMTDGWDYFFGLRKHPWLPSNALIISDDYLFDNEQNSNNLGVRNLKSIIPNLLPKTLDTDFQILIISSIPHNNRGKAENISNDLTNFIHNLKVPYKCKITLVFSKAIHPRKAMSNYYVMTCDKGFCVYCKKPENKVFDTNFVDIMSNFHSIAETSGTNGYDDTSLCLNDLKKYCTEAQQQAQAELTKDSVLISGDCGPDFAIENRLFND